MKKITVLLIMLILSFQVFAQEDSVSGPEAMDFDYGTVEKNIYKNSYFGFEAEVPEGWFVQSKETTKQLIEKGKEMVAGDDKTLKAAIKASEINTAYLLTVFQNELGSPVSYNPSFIIMVENLKMYPGIKSGKDYLFFARRLMKQSPIQYSGIDDDFVQLKIGGREFHAMNVVIEYAGMGIKQTYYASIINGFAFNIVVSYIEDDQKAVLDKFIKSAKFSK